jgi:hypothetical protein
MERTMDTLAVYPGTFDPSPLLSASPGLRALPARTVRELAAILVDEPDVICVLLKSAVSGGDLRRLLLSLKDRFPLVEVVGISDGKQEFPEWVHNLDGGMPPARLSEALAAHLSSVSRNKRGCARFDWPLQGMLTADHMSWKNYRVRSLGACGAFLESRAHPRELGAEPLLRIKCQGFSILTRCRPLDMRHGSSQMPAGFGVTFTDLSPASTRVVDHIIRDSLISALLAPDTEPSLPSLTDVDAFSVDQVELL